MFKYILGFLEEFNLTYCKCYCSSALGNYLLLITRRISSVADKGLENALSITSNSVWQ
jgi:hypothetical protein